MKKLLLFGILSFVYINFYGQTITSIFTNIDTISLGNGASPGEIEILGSNATPIISTACGFNIKHFGVVYSLGTGKAMGLAHEGIMSNGTINFQDNTLFFEQAFNWLSNATTSANILLKDGWIHSGNSTLIKTQLQNLGYSFTSTNSSLSSSLLTSTDILILGNDWNGSTPYSTSEINAVSNFVNNGGSVLILGLGWSWPNSITDYPMNSIASLFNFKFSVNGINETEFINFHPTDTSFEHCHSPFVNTNIARGDSLRVLKMAVSSTGEFTTENGGVTNTTLLIENWLEELNQMYGREYAIHFELIPNNIDLIFTNAITDPWTTIPFGSGGCDDAGLINAKHVIDSIIGPNNYDLNHVIISPSLLNGGCASSLTFAISGGLNIPITRHEIGHQFGQSHTINYSDNNNFEPENGAWTLQGGNAQGRAHGHSYHQLALTLKNSPNLGTKVSTGNSIPTIQIGSDYSIPKNTPFSLKAEVNDDNSEDSLTIVWDNMDKGIPQYIPVSDDRQGALFMRLLPTTETSRTFPKIEDVLANNTSNTQEQLPTQTRYMNIRATVNDNRKMLYSGNTINASGTHSDDIKLTVTNDGPFNITSQNTNGINYPGLTTQTIEWNVNNTDQSPINVSHVKISLSDDGGYTFPYVLHISTPNDGSEAIEIPEINTSLARVKVEAIDNLFFNINTNNFTITSVIGLVDDINVQFNIYPNPVSTVLYIQTNTMSSDYSITLISMLGETVLKVDDTTEIDISDLQNGIYFIELIENNTKNKLVKKIEVLHCK